MRRAIAILIVGVICGAAILTWRAASSRPLQTLESLGQALETAATNPVEFAKNQITGGIGVALATNRGDSFPVIKAVNANSPADRAGLREGDLLIKVDGLSASNRPLRQIAGDIKGFSGGQLTLTIRRGSSPDFECIVDRTSWNTLRGLNYKEHDSGFVPDAKTAIKIAVAIWEPIYGEKPIADQKPYRASLTNGVWIVEGTFHGSGFGQVAAARIAKDDGKILMVSYGTPAHGNRPHGR
jgi:hypothetical protein